jgi:hypothetical protein
VAKMSKAMARRLLEQVKSKCFKIMGDQRDLAQIDRTRLMNMFNDADKLIKKLK